MTRTQRVLDCTNLDELMKNQGMNPEQEVRDMKWFISEREGRDVGEAYTKQIIFDTIVMEAWLKLGGVPYFCKHHCDHKDCRYNGLIAGEASGG